jgi:putative cardiolipin synthase
MVADDTILIVGGRNIADHYFGVHGESNYRDLDVLAVPATISTRAPPTSTPRSPWLVAVPASRQRMVTSSVRSAEKADRGTSGPSPRPCGTVSLVA